MVSNPGVPSGTGRPESSSTSVMRFSCVTCKLPAEHSYAIAWISDPPYSFITGHPKTRWKSDRWSS